jgi:OOP family OmpA-OmpF porin
MKTRHFVTSLLIMFLASALAGCAGMPAKTIPDLSCTTARIAEMLKSGDYHKKVDNFIIIQDASKTMDGRVSKDTSSPGKLALSKGLINCMNNALVEELELKAGMRVFGPYPSEEGLIYGMTPYTKTGLKEAVETVQRTDDKTCMGAAILDAANDLKQVDGHSAVIIFSDGGPQVVDPVAAAAEMIKIHGDRVSIYTVVLGDDPNGIMTMEDIAAQSGCGFATLADNLYTKPLTDCDTVNTGKGMGNFVARVFLDRDDDRDGVINCRDKCPDTPIGVKVDQFGCPLPVPVPVLDSDGDGVPDSRDKCPDTPKGIKVDKDGCPIPLKEKVSITLLVEFDFDKDKVKFLYDGDIEKVANLLKAYPKTDVELDGHTDSIGTDEYNMDLGKRRAESVKRYLVEKFGIDASRISTKSLGESMPVSTNDTPAGRQNNRRVVANIEAVTE